jgi:DNA polymerase (family 10)
MANGLDERRALEHARRIRELNKKIDGITILAGIECDIRADGTMDLADECLAELDIVVASVHSAFNLDEERMTQRILRAISCPWVDVLGHPSGRVLLKREPYGLQFERVVAAAVAAGVAIEINSQPHRLDVDERHAKWARDLGAKLMINSDAHSPTALGYTRWGTMIARRAWLEPGDVLNTLPVKAFRKSLRRERTRKAQ